MASSSLSQCQASNAAVTVAEIVTVSMMSGHHVAAIQLGELDDVKALKHKIQEWCSIPSCRQRLLYQSSVLDGDTKLTSPMDLELAVLPLHSPTEPEGHEFLRAACRGSASTVRNMLELPIDPDVAYFKFYLGSTALCLAARHGHVETAQELT